MDFQCSRPEKESELKYFLTYHQEDIKQFNHPDIIPLKLDQTEYFEYESYRMLKPEDIPDVLRSNFKIPSELELSELLRINACV